jgi:hypothetical protein
MVVILRYAEKFCIFFPEKILPCVCGEMEIRDLGNRAHTIADHTILKMSFVFLRLRLI